MSTTPGERPGGPAAPQETVAASCPFCGAKGAKIVPAGHIDWTVECGQCGARGPRNNAGAWALVRWNTAALRTALEQAQQDPARLLRAIASDSFAATFQTLGQYRSALLSLQCVVTDYGAMLRGEIDPQAHPDRGAAWEAHQDAQSALTAIRDAARSAGKAG